jgi:MFS family permease
VLRWWVTAAWPDSLALMVLAQTTHAFSFAAFFAAAMLLLAEYFPGRHNGHGQGVFYGLSSGVGGVIGALLAGQLWRFGGQAAFAVSGFVALAACLVAWHCRYQTRSSGTWYCGSEYGSSVAGAFGSTLSATAGAKIASACATVSASTSR